MGIQLRKFDKLIHYWAFSKEQDYKRGKIVASKRRFLKGVLYNHTN